MREAGAKALNSTLNGKDAVPVSPSDFREKKAALYFQPKDNTPGCARQAFARAYEAFKVSSAEEIPAYLRQAQ